MKCTAAQQISVATFSSLLDRSGRLDFAVEAGRSLADIVAEAVALRIDKEPDGRRGVWQRLVVVHNGRPLEDGDLAAVEVRFGDSVLVAPRPGEPFTTGELLLALLAVGSAAASYVLASSALKASSVKGPSSAEESRPGFNRVSRQAVAGDPTPRVFGRRKYGGKVVSVVPVDSVDGINRLRMLILFGGGPIGGVGSLTTDVDNLSTAGITGLELNNQPISNFPGVRLWFRTGTAGQAIIPGFADTEVLRDVGVGGTPLRNTSGSERTGGSASAEAVTVRTLGAVDALTVRIRFPGGLARITDQGTVQAQVAKYRARTRVADTGGGSPGAWSAWTVAAPERSTRSEFTSGLRIDGLTPRVVYDVQVERVSAESDAGFIIDSMVWDSVVETQYAANTYAGLAVLALEITAGENINDVPSVSADVLGQSDLRRWDGVSSPLSPSFTTGPSSNPADAALALITSAVYGGGAIYSDADVDFPSLLAWRSVCDQDVARTAGGTRKRHTYNRVLDDRRGFWETLREICRAGRCVPITRGRTIAFVYDGVQSTAAQLFTDGSVAVADAGDEASAASIELGYVASTGGIAVANRVVVQFDDETRRGANQPAAWPPIGTLWLGGGSPEPVREQSVRLEGITDPEEAAAYAKYLCKTLRFRSRTISLEITQPLPSVEPGERFDVASSLVGYAVLSGRLRFGSTTSQVVLDQDLTLAAGTYRITVVFDDQTVETRTLIGFVGTTAAGTPLGVSTPFSRAPERGAQFAVLAAGKDLKPYTCTRIEAVDGNALRWRVSGLEYVADVYNDAVSVADLPRYSTLGSPTTPPGPMLSLLALERVVNGTPQVELSWRQATDDQRTTAAFRIYRRLLGSGIWVPVPEPKVGGRGAVVDIPDADSAYQFVVVAVSALGAALSPDDPRHPRATLAIGLGKPGPYAGGLAIARDSGTGSYTITTSLPAGPVLPGEDPGLYDAVGVRVLFGGAAWDNLSPGGIWTHRDAIVWSKATGAGVFSGLRLAPGKVHRFRERCFNSADRQTFGAYVATVTPTVPPGKSIKQTTDCNLSTSGGGTGTGVNTTYAGGVLKQTSPASAATWTSPEYDTGSATDSELMVWMDPANVHGDPALNVTAFTIPSLVADQWGTWSDGVTQQLFPPYPDDEIGILLEAQTNAAASGGTWSDWQTVAPGKSISGIFRRYKLRATITRKNAPNAFGLAALSAVIVH